VRRKELYVNKKLDEKNDYFLCSANRLWNLSTDWYVSVRLGPKGLARKKEILARSLASRAINMEIF
jgi:hypothetical protein